MLVTKKPVTVEAITFEEFVQYGLANTNNVVDGFPWSFNYKGHPVTHENNECYLIPTTEGVMKFTPGDMLITGVKGEIYPCKKDIFEETYSPAKPQISNPQQVEVITEKSTYAVNTYVVTNDGMANGAGALIKFCKGNREDESVPRQEGFFTETLIAVSKKYLEDNNVGELASREGSMAITNLDQALMWIEKRAKDRAARGVQGTYKK